MTTLVLIAKEPISGKVKTRLHPPLSLDQAASLAAAAIDDTIRALEGIAASRRILLFDGANPPPSCDDYEVIAQTSGGLDTRLGAIFDTVEGPTLLIGMDTPQLTAAHLAPVFPQWVDSVDAWFGPASDGGYWAIGMREPRGDLIRGVPMSQADTGEHQLQRFSDARLTVGVLETLTDVDTIQDALTVAKLAPLSKFAMTLRRFTDETPIV